jgi:pimeloyl-ACP methyl ester carboxylesterase
MSAQRLETACVIGHSMGGKTAMQLALQFPGRVEKLIVADMAPRAYLPAHEKILAALLALNLPAFTTRQEMEDALAPEIPGLVLRRFLLKNLGRDANGKFFWKMNLQGLSDNYLELGKPVSGSAPFAGPALFIRGEKSDYVNPGDGALIRELFPVSEIQTIAGAGHWLTADKPEEFLRLVLDFL